MKVRLTPRPTLLVGGSGTIPIEYACTYPQAGKGMVRQPRTRSSPSRTLISEGQAREGERHHRRRLEGSAGGRVSMTRGRPRPSLCLNHRPEPWPEANSRTCQAPEPNITGAEALHRHPEPWPQGPISRAPNRVTPGA